jgi:hypothetical protein
VCHIERGDDLFLQLLHGGSRGSGLRRR